MSNEIHLESTLRTSVLIVRDSADLAMAERELDAGTLDVLIVDGARLGVAALELLAHAAVFYPDVTRMVFAAGAPYDTAALRRQGIVDHVIGAAANTQLAA